MRKVNKKPRTLLRMGFYYLDILYPKDGDEHPVSKALKTMNELLAIDTSANPYAYHEIWSEGYGVRIYLKDENLISYALLKYPNARVGKLK